MDLLIAFAVAMSITMGLIPLLHRVAGRMHVLDQPHERKVHARPIPRIGGLAMTAGMIVPLLISLHADPRLLPFLGGVVVLLAMGVWDDRADLGPRTKLAAQLAAALIVVSLGGVMIHSVTLVDRVELPALVAAPLTVFFIVGVTNAINLSDGLDGLAGGTTLLCCCAVALLALSSDVSFVSTVAIILAGSLLGFLRYNTYPALIFMGDGGSQVLGFSIATLAVMLTQDARVPVSAALPLLLLGLPILDTLTVMGQRIREGRSPFAADKNHLHHKLLSRGFDHHEAVVVIYGVQAILFLAAWFLRYESDLLIVLVYAAFATAALALLFSADRLHWHWRGAAPDQALAQSPLARRISWLRQPQRLPRWSMLAAGSGAATYMFATVGLADGVPRDVGLLAAVMLVLLTATAVLAGRAGETSGWLQQAVLYVSVVIVVFLDLRSHGVWRLSAHAAALLFSALAVCLFIAFRTDPVRRFRLTPLDLIVIFVALTLPNLPGGFAAGRSLGISALILLVLFYAVELTFNQGGRTHRTLLGAGGLLLALIALRGLTNV